jgi:hypothetical protein
VLGPASFGDMALIIGVTVADSQLMREKRRSRGQSYRCSIRKTGHDRYHRDARKLSLLQEGFYTFQEVNEFQPALQQAKPTATQPHSRCKAGETLYFGYQQDYWRAEYERMIKRSTVTRYSAIPTVAGYTYSETPANTVGTRL